jgi:hypothetical protein
MCESGMIAATTPAGMPSSTSATTAPVVGMVEGPDGKHPVCGGGGGGRGLCWVFCSGGVRNLLLQNLSSYMYVY